jgi:hypothetical protein
MTTERPVTDRVDAGVGDVILPAQYFGAMGTSGLSGEQRLMLAVLVDAINILQRWQRVDSAHKRRAFAEAAHWVNTRRTSCQFSFDNVCDALDIDSKVLRDRLSGLTTGHANATRLGGGRLRLKESGRTQRVTAVRERRRNRGDLATMSA